MLLTWCATILFFCLWFGQAMLLSDRGLSLVLDLLIEKKDRFEKTSSVILYFFLSRNRQSITQNIHY